MTTSSVSSTPPSVSTGNAQDVSGLTSGSVSLSLAEAVSTKVQPYLDQASAIQTEINTNQTQIAAYQNMQSLLQSLQSAAANLTNEAVAGTNVFQNRVANLTTTGATQASSILSASVASGTTVGNHTVTVNQLATAESDTSATLHLGQNDPISNLTGSGFNGNIMIAESGKSGAVPVAITPAMTLSQVAAAINATTSTNGVTASVVSVDSNDSVLVLSGQDANTPLTFQDSGSILQALGVQSTQLTGSVASPPAVSQAGSFTINAGSTAVPVTVNAGDSLSTIAQNINTAAGGSSEISASVVNDQLVITDSASNSITFTGVTGNALSSLGFSANGAAHQVTAAQAANLTVDGVTGITRSTNTVTDVLNGVTLNLTQASTSQVSVQITPDLNGANTAINNFVTAYNSWESFVQQNEATASGGGAASGAVLFGDSSLRDASLQVDSAITQDINGTSLGALGISLNSSNQLTVDSTALDNALTNNFSTVSNFFQSTVTTNSSNLQPSSTDFSTYSGTFTLSITASGGNITSLQLNGGSAANDFIYAGNTISGLYGTPYAGMYFTYSGTSDTVKVTATQGMANQVYTTADNFADPNTGSLQTLVTDKENQDIQYTSQYNNWINEANDYTNFLLTQYSSLTTQIQSAGQTLNTLNALFTAQYSNG